MNKLFVSEKLSVGAYNNSNDNSLESISLKRDLSHRNAKKKNNFFTYLNFT